jgi:hypothetical protein
LCFDLLVWLLRGTEAALLAPPKLLDPPLLRCPRPSVAKKALVCDEWAGDGWLDVLMGFDAFETFDDKAAGGLEDMISCYQPRVRADAMMSFDAAASGFR